MKVKSIFIKGTGKKQEESFILEKEEVFEYNGEKIVPITDENSESQENVTNIDSFDKLCKHCIEDKEFFGATSFRSWFQDSTGWNTIDTAEKIQTYFTTLNNVISKDKKNSLIEPTYYNLSSSRCHSIHIIKIQEGEN